jgi:hypothetical protein
MAKAWILKAIGVVDGVNKAFNTSTFYVPGSLVVYLNGDTLDRDSDNGWVELGGNSFELKEIPETGDTVWTYYRPA